MPKAIAQNKALSLAEPSTSGSFAAISTLEPEIEIWNLDVLDALQPAQVLGGRNGDGGAQKPEKKSKKRRNREGFKAGSHTDSVLALAWNTTFRNVLASGSADKTIKVPLWPQLSCAPGVPVCFQRKDMITIHRLTLHHSSILFGRTETEQQNSSCGWLQARGEDTPLIRVQSMTQPSNGSETL